MFAFDSLHNQGKHRNLNVVSTQTHKYMCLAEVNTGATTDTTSYSQACMLLCLSSWLVTSQPLQLLTAWPKNSLRHFSHTTVSFGHDWSAIHSHVPLMCIPNLKCIFYIIAYAYSTDLQSINASRSLSPGWNVPTTSLRSRQVNQAPKPSVTDRTPVTSVYPRKGASRWH